EPVVQHPHVHAGACLLYQMLGELETDGIGSDDVVLEMDPAAGRVDDLEHRAVGVCILQQRNLITGNGSAAGRAIEGVLDCLARPLGRRVAHAVPSPSRASWGRSAARTTAISSSSGSPSSSAPWRISSRFTPRA